MAAGVTPVNYITITANAGDTIGPQPISSGPNPPTSTTFLLNRQGGSVILTSNGVNKWIATMPLQKLTVNNAYATNQSIAGNANTYVTGSSCQILPGYWTANSNYRCRFDLVKTAAGTGAFKIDIRLGTAGTTADTSLVTLTYGAGTAAADTGIFEVWASFRSVGAGTAAVLIGETRCTHHLAATGLISTGVSGTGIIPATGSATFDSTTQTTIGISANGQDALFNAVCGLVEAEYKQP
jgi:hypothetical protein